MDFAFTEEQRELRATARAFLAERSGSAQVRAAMESELGYDRELWKAIGSELGWTSLLIPEDCGGSGLGFVELAALLELTGEALLCAPLFSTLALGANALLVAGSDAQRREHLPRIAAGEVVATLAAGAAAAPGAPAAEPWLRREGNALVLSGAVRHVLDGPCADLFVVAARRDGTRGDDGLSLVLVPAELPGVERRALPTMDRTRRLAELGFRDVRLPASALLGEEGTAAASLRAILDRAAVALAAELVGVAQRCLDLAVDYAKQRVQFGRPIGSFQAIQHKCADLLVAVETARSGAYYAACVAADGGEELAPLAALAKATASETAFRCAADCLQIHGGVGFTWEYDVHLYLKRARAMEGFLGSPAFHRERVAQQLGL